GTMRPGDAFVLNAPYNGGTHLPDITVIAPVFLDDEPLPPGGRGRGEGSGAHSAEEPLPLLPQGEGSDPVRNTARPEFFVASRGHHADIGGTTPGSMPCDSTHVEEEGVLLDNIQLVAGGRFLADELRAILGSGKYPSRNIDQNLADLRAQVASCTRGIGELNKMV